jgi:outer membrane protein
LKTKKEKKEIKMKKTIILMAAIFLLSAFAFSEIKIGVINPQKIMDSTKKGLEVQNRLQKLQNDKQKQGQAMQEEIKKLEKEVLSPALNNEARQKKTIELQEKQKALRRFAEDARNEFRLAYQKELAALEKEILPLIENLGKQKGFTVIFDVTTTGIAYYDQAIDITDEVIKAIDAKFSK